MKTSLILADIKHILEEIQLLRFIFSKKFILYVLKDGIYLYLKTIL